MDAQFVCAFCVYMDVTTVGWIEGLMFGWFHTLMSLDLSVHVSIDQDADSCAHWCPMVARVMLWRLRCSICDGFRHKCTKLVRISVRHLRLSLLYISYTFRCTIATTRTSVCEG